MSNLVLSDSEPFELEIIYWKKKLQGVTPLHLSTDYARPAVQSGIKASVEFSIGKDIYSKLALLSEEQQVPLFSTLLSVFKVLLYRYSSQEDICVGSIVDCTVEEGNVDAFIN